MFGDIDWPLNALRGVSAIAEFVVPICYDELQGFGGGQENFGGCGNGHEIMGMSGYGEKFAEVA